LEYRGIKSPTDTADLNSQGRFTDRVDDYVRYRPTYPPEAIGFIRSELGLCERSAVADVGSGTGIFTEILLDTGAAVYAVEPNDAMRAAAESMLGARRGFKSVKGTAEATTLDAGSVSIVTCAQAFHWFDVAGTRREFARILAPRGWCVLIWNTSVIGESAFALGYEKIKADFRTDFNRIRHETLERSGRFDAFFGCGTWEKKTFGNFQTLDLKGLKGRLLSSSYAPKEGHPRFEPMIAALGELFDRCQTGGVIRMDYTTEVFYGHVGNSPVGSEPPACS
jgi:SAM-dependent methyltransferase